MVSIERFKSIWEKFSTVGNWVGNTMAITIHNNTIPAPKEKTLSCKRSLICIELS
jgi:hypothetical protein